MLHETNRELPLITPVDLPTVEQLQPLPQRAVQLAVELPPLPLVEPVEKADLPPLKSSVSDKPAPELAPLPVKAPEPAVTAPKPARTKPAAVITKPWDAPAQAPKTRKSRPQVTATAKKVVATTRSGYESSKQRSLKGKQALIGAAAVAAAVTGSRISKARTVVKGFDGVISDSLKFPNTPTFKRAKATNPVSDLKESALKFVVDARNRVTERFTQLNESKLNESMAGHQRVLMAAAGLIAVSGMVYLRYKGMQGPEEFADVNVASETTTPAKEAVPTPIGTGNSLANLNALEELTSSAAETVTEIGDTVTVDQGDGVTDVLIDQAAEQGIDLSAAESYEIYSQLEEQFGKDMFTSNTYVMSNGDIGFSNSGQFMFNFEAQRVLDEFIEAEKKKKGLA